MREMLRVLIIDDEREIVRGLSVRLKAAGYDVQSASDGQAGINAANAILPDAVLLDLQMPGMDGLAVLEDFRNHEATRAVPVIVLSANVMDPARLRARQLGANCFLAKPFQAERLLAAVAEATHRGGAPARSPLLHAAGASL